MHNYEIKSLKVDLVLKIDKDNLVHAIIKFQNLGGTNIYLDKNLICNGNRLEANVFEFKCDNNKIRYSGKLIKRNSSTREDFIELAPKQEYVSQVILNGRYTFLEGEYKYQIKYSAYHGHPYDEHFLEEVNSNIVDFVYKQ